VKPVLHGEGINPISGKASSEAVYVDGLVASVEQKWVKAILAVVCSLLCLLSSQFLQNDLADLEELKYEAFVALHNVKVMSCPYTHTCPCLHFCP
jgi:hypothetical protein